MKRPAEMVSTELEISSTIELLARRWTGAGSLLPAFKLLAAGRPLEVGEVAEASGSTVEKVAKALDAARSERDARSRLVDLYGLSLAPTLHRLEIDGKFLHSCCALWAHVIPKLVDRRVTIESIDPVRRSLVRLSVSPDRVESTEPLGAVATIAVATQEAIDADVGAAFCSQVRHFASRGSAEEFAAERPTCQVLTLAELQDAAGQLHEAIWSATGA